MLNHVILKGMPCRLFRLVLPLIAVPVATGFGSSSDWLQVKGDSFVAYSDASQKDLIDFAVKYAAFQKLRRELFLPPGEKFPTSTLILFRRSNTLQEHVPTDIEERSSIGYSIEIDGAPLMAFAMAGNRDLAMGRIFEFETILTFRRLGYYAPLWMAQGAGKVMSSIKVLPGKVRVGTIPEEGYPSSFNLSTDALPWARFFDVSLASPEYLGKKNHGVYHAQCWALMNWILFSSTDTRQRISQLCRNLRSEHDIEAVESLMGTPSAGFIQAIERHRQQYPKGHEVVLDETVLRTSFTIRPADEAEVLVQTSNLLAASGKIEKSDAHLERARLLAPESISVKEASARLAQRGKNEQEAVRLYREAIVLGSTNSVAYLKSASARLDAISAGGQDKMGSGTLEIDSALAEIRKAIALNPGSTKAYVMLGRAFYLAPTVSAEMVAELSAGIRPGEDGWRVLNYRAFLNERLGQINNALADLQRIQDDPQVSESGRRAAENRTAMIRYNSIEEKTQILMKENRFTEARLLVSEARQNERDFAARQRYIGLLKRVVSEERFQQGQTSLDQIR